MAAWEQGIRQEKPTEWTVVKTEHLDEGGQKYYEMDDGSTIAAGYAPTIHAPEFRANVKPAKISAFRLELMNDQDLPRGGPGRSIYGTCALTEFQVDAAPLDHPDQRIKLEIQQGDGRRESARARAG